MGGHARDTRPAEASDADRREAFATCVEPEIPVLLQVGRSLAGSTADAEDLVQETLIRAHRALDRFDGVHPRAWLQTSCGTPHRTSPY